MEAGVVHDREEIVAALDGLTAAFDTVAGLSFDTLTHPELLSVLDRLENLAWRTPTLGRPLIARLAAEAAPVELGAKSLKAVLTERLRISGGEAQHRLDDAKLLGPRTALTGEPLEPIRAHTAEAQQKGRIGPEHVATIGKFFATLPSWVDPTTREQSEADLVGHAAALGPDAFAKVAHRLATVIDQDGPEPDDTERARKRFISIGKQRADGTAKITGCLDPEALATIEAIQAKWGAPGMCNPDDEHPRTSGTPSQTQIDEDIRTSGQRLHDAFIAIGRHALASGELGQHNGLPVSVIVTTTLQDLQNAAGSGVTAGGTVIPMADVIRLASHAYHYLAIFDKHTNVALYLGRTKRIASVGQRIVLYARDRGCTKPGCTVPAHGTQVHHVNHWASRDGQTNIDEEVLACPGDNRLAEAGWTVVIRDGHVEWIPPPHLDTGQTRINDYHHPERLLDPNRDEGDPG